MAAQRNGRGAFDPNFGLEERISAARAEREFSDTHAQVLLWAMVYNWDHGQVDARLMDYLVAAIRESLAPQGPALEQALGLRRKKAGNPNFDAVDRYHGLCGFIRHVIEVPRSDLAGWHPAEREPSRTNEDICIEILHVVGEYDAELHPKGWAREKVLQAIREVREQIRSDEAEWMRYSGDEGAAPSE